MDGPSLAGHPPIEGPWGGFQSGVKERRCHALAQMTSHKHLFWEVLAGVCPVLEDIGCMFIILVDVVNLFSLDGVPFLLYLQCMRMPVPQFIYSTNI